ncbi:MAG: 30S ribosomal protein S16 [Candidatus Omnitrophica bacterium CG07_land_8_20_14_0_80_42_15]|uniref:Small ribosomal subunit protein bS16 n=1 Tax=Candidatus Aquitaenariimonas noxiae TaxID=1974741 RepID=A0A2J0KU67_9BACT|nr:MAG: 30S ribosomal protein S16 [Candidatus Omnitrophica bacterium CG07_land_8_20_14_0_80_42_15]
MAVVIRLRRMGTNKRPFNRVVVADSRSSRDGRFLEGIGYYNPLTNPAQIKIDAERAKHWVKAGAKPSVAVKNLFKKAGIKIE